MAGVNISFAGKIKQKLDASKLAWAVDAEMQNLSQMFEAEVKRNTPVLTGRLKNSFVGEKVGFLTGRVSSNVEYAPYVEFGTARQAPAAMVRKGAEAMKTKGTEYLKARLAKLK